MHQHLYWRYKRSKAGNSYLVSCQCFVYIIIDLLFEANVYNLQHRLNVSSGILNIFQIVHHVSKHAYVVLHQLIHASWNISLMIHDKFVNKRQIHHLFENRMKNTLITSEPPKMLLLGDFERDILFQRNMHWT